MRLAIRRRLEAESPGAIVITSYKDREMGTFQGDPTTVRDLGSVGLKLIGVVFCLMGLVSLPLALEAFTFAARSGLDAGIRFTPFGWLLRALLQIALGLWLVFRGDRIAGWILPSPGGVELAVEPRTLLEVLLAALGVFLVADSLPSLVQRLVDWVSIGGGPRFALGGRPVTLWGDLIRIAVGAALFIGARQLASLWQRARSHD